VLRVEDEEHEIMGCAYHHLTQRLLTPLYHPTVGPSGVIALWLDQEWDRRQRPWQIVSTIVQQLNLDVPPIFHQSMQKQLRPVHLALPALLAAHAHARAFMILCCCTHRLLRRR
jgi:hypothetical protein